LPVPCAWLAAALLAVAALACGRSSAPPERIVLVTVDTLRADRVGCYGAALARTPTFDAVAAAGVQFDAAIAPTPLTLPSHASLLTGRTPPAHGVRHNSVFRLADDVPTLPAALAEAGYATAAFVGAFVLDRQFGLARGFATYDDHMPPPRAGAPAGAYAERTADAVVDAALAWLEQAPARFFLWVHLYDPHAEYAPPLGFAAAFPGAPYEGEIAFADTQIGRLLAAVDARWDPARTLVVLTSDHGESLGEHGEATHGYGVYEATQHVPLVARGPGLPAGRRAPGVVSLIDVAPTVLALAGLPPLEGAQGRDLRAALDGPGGEAYVETLATHFDFGWSPLFGLRTPTHKYVRAPRPELYFLADDPRETRDLAAGDAALVAQLDTRVAAWQANARPVRFGAALDPDERARLESLGYVVPEAEPGAEAEAPAVGGPDPKDELPRLARLKVAERLIAAGRGEAALEALAELPDRGFLVPLLRSHAALLAGDAGLAERAARAAVAAADRHEAVYLALGQALERQGRFAEAGRAFAEARARNPGSADALLGLARAAEAAGERDRALALYDEAAAAPGAPPGEAAWRRAALLLESGDAEAYDAALAALPEPLLREPAAALRLAAAERAAGRSESARERLAALVARPDAPAAAFAYYAEWLEADGRIEEALAVREARAAREPDSVSARNDLAWALAAAGRDLDRALALAQAAAAAAPAEPSVLDTLATVRLRRGEPAEALEAADAGLAHAGDGALRARLLYVRAEALAALGRRGEAAGALREALDALGDAEPAWRAPAERLAASLGARAR